MANDAFMRMVSEINMQIKEMQDEMTFRLLAQLAQPTMMESVRDSFRARFAHMYSPA